MMTFTANDIAARPEALSQAVAAQGSARLKTSDGREYVLRSALGKRTSPLRVRGVQPLKPITRDEIVAIVREGREREPQWMTEMFERMEAANRARAAADTPPAAPGPSSGGPADAGGDDRR